MELRAGYWPGKKMVVTEKREYEKWAGAQVNIVFQKDGVTFFAYKWRVNDSIYNHKFVNTAKIYIILSIVNANIP